MSALQVVAILLLAGCLLVAVWLVLLWLRRRSIAAHGPMCPSAVRMPGSPRWRLGLLRLGSHDLEWFSVAGVSTSPTMRWAREGLDISVPATERVSVPGLDQGVRLTLTGEVGHVIDLAVEAKLYPAVRSWLESAPPGHNGNVT